MSWLFRAVLALVLASIATCADAGADASAGAGTVALGPAPPSITVFAAASLKESLDAVAHAWTAQSGQRVVLSYGATSALARQIDQGAPAAVFVSADAEWMDWLAERKLIDSASRFDVVGNRLVVVVPAASPVRELHANDTNAWVRILGADGRLAVADVETVPAGRYARESLQALHVWPRVQDRLAPAENVRAALAFVARGEAMLGVVYATDALVEPRVRVVARLRDETHARIVYPAARVASVDSATTAGFLRYLRGPQARAVFLRAGFTAP